MVAIERDNPRLKGVLPKEYARPALDKHRLGELIDLIGTIGMGDKASRSKDILGRVYEYFLGQFASAEGKKGGQFYTPQSVVRLLVELSTTRRLAVMNPESFRGIEADFGPEHADTFRRDLHPDLRADYVLANPPFNDSDWFRKDDDVRWQYGVPPRGNANFAWPRKRSGFIHHLAPHGMAGFVLANGPAGAGSSHQSGEGDIRHALIEADLVDCMVALPGQLFYSTQIPVCLWFLVKSKAVRVVKGLDNSTPASFRERRRETLFIDARKMGKLIDRVHRELTEADHAKIVNTYHAWRGNGGTTSVSSTYADIPGFCKSATTAEIASHGHVLTPGRYVGAQEIEDEGEPFEEKMKRLTVELQEQFAESSRLERAIRQNLNTFSTFPNESPS